MPNPRRAMDARPPADPHALPPTPGLDHNPLGASWGGQRRDVPRVRLWPIVVVIGALGSAGALLVLVSS